MPLPNRHSCVGRNPPGPDRVGGLLGRCRQTVDPGSAPGMTEKTLRPARADEPFCVAHPLLVVPEKVGIRRSPLLVMPAPMGVLRNRS